MKKLVIISVISAGIAGVGCNGVQREPNRVYMPDMAYSRAYETYQERDTTAFTTDAAAQGDRIFYNNRPVAGTIARGEDMPFPYAKDKAGDTVNYYASRSVVNPEPELDKAQFAEAQRLYMINCAICHGSKLDGNGPLYKDGTGPYPAAPKNLIADPVVSKMPDGQLFYSITYGKNLMGAYASQISRKQRWQIVHFIKAKQAEANGGKAPAPAAGDPKGTLTLTPAKDTSVAPKMN